MDEYMTDQYTISQGANAAEDRGAALVPVSQGALAPWAAQPLTPQQIQLVKDTVARGCTDDELRLLLYMAQRYGLDPLRHEIWCIKMKQGEPALIMTGRDGFLKIAMRDPGYAGLQAFVVKAGDLFEIDAMSGEVTHKFAASAARSKAPILGAWARAWHKERPPMVSFVEFDEYRRETPTWRSNPSAMIQKVAEVFVLRRQFNVSGLVAHEEINMDTGGVAPAARQPELACHARVAPDCTGKITTLRLRSATGQEIMYSAAQVAKQSQDRLGKQVCFKCAQQLTQQAKLAAPATPQQVPAAPQQSKKPALVPPKAAAPAPSEQVPQGDPLFEEWGALYRQAQAAGLTLPVSAGFPITRGELSARIAQAREFLAAATAEPTEVGESEEPQDELSF